MLKSCLGCCKLEIGGLIAFFSLVTVQLILFRLSGYMIGCAAVVLELIYLIRKSLIAWDLMNMECEDVVGCSHSRAGEIMRTRFVITN